MNGNANPTASARLVTPDVFKGLGLIIIVFVHLFVLVPGAGNSGTSVAAPLQILYAALIGFFIIAGYFYRPGRGFLVNVKKRVIKLVVALAFCNLVLPLVLYAYMWATGQPVDIGHYVDAVINLAGGVPFQSYGQTYENAYIPQFVAYNGYYFLYVILWASVIFYAVADKALENWKVGAVAVFVLVTLTFICLEFVPFRLQWSLQLAPISAAFMIVGAYAAKYDVLSFIENGWKTGKYWLVFVIALAAALVFVFTLPPGTGFNISKLGAYGGYSAYPFFVTGIFSTYVVLVLMAMLGKIPVLVTALTAVGRHSLAMLLFHTVVIKVLLAPFMILTTEAWFPKLPMWQDVVLGIATVVIITLVAEYVYPRLVSRIGNASAGRRSA